MGGAPVIESEGRSLSDRASPSRPRRREADRGRDGGRDPPRARRGGGRPARLPARRRRDRADRRAARRAARRASTCTASTAASIPRAQRAAIAAPPPGRRKLVLATSIAETSLTLDGVRIVVDSAASRAARATTARAGMTRLVTERASQAAVAQRAGRAGRQGPGLRLSPVGGSGDRRRCRASTRPRSSRRTLARCCSTAPSGASPIPRTLALARSAARRRGRRGAQPAAALGALDARWPAHRAWRGDRRAAAAAAPRAYADRGRRRAAGRGPRPRWRCCCRERGLGGNDADLELRLAALAAGEGPARGSGARSWRSGGQPWPPLPLAGGDRGERPVEPGTAPPPAPPASGRGALGPCIALAFPDRLSRRRDASGEDWISVGGRGFRLDPHLAARPRAMACRRRGRAASPPAPASSPPRRSSEADASRPCSPTGSRPAPQLAFDPGDRRRPRPRAAAGSARSPSREGRDATRRSRRKSRPPCSKASGPTASSCCPGAKPPRALRRRAAFARALRRVASRSVRRGPARQRSTTGCRRLLAGQAQPPRRRARRARRRARRPARLGGAQGGRPARARAHFDTPAGSSHAIDYDAEAGPTVDGRGSQALFGLAEHPTVAGGRVPLVLSLTSPAGRPIQTTRDLPGFWAGSWAAVAKEMRGRYPRHPWPDDPAAADPTLRTKNARRASARRLI